MKFIIIFIAVCLIIAGYRSSKSEQNDVAVEPVPAVSTANTPRSSGGGLSGSGGGSAGPGVDSIASGKTRVPGGAYGLVSAVLSCPDDAAPIVATGTASPTCVR